MSKPYYETEEYSEAENELDTYDDKVKLVMEYRVSEKHKDQQIAELKEQLKNVIVPKFQVGQDIFVILDDVVKETSVNSITIFTGNELSYYCKNVGNERMYLELDEEEIFATKEEAEARLKELKGEKK